MSKYHDLECEFKRFKGQPIEVITEDHKYCGIDVEADEESVVLLDKCSRMIRIEYSHIEAVIEPMMALTPLCKDVDCECDRNDCDGNGNGNGNGRYCDND